MDAVKLKRSPYAICVFNIYAPFKTPFVRNYLEEFKFQVSLLKDFIEKNNSFLLHAKNYKDVEKALRENKIACVLAIEGGHLVENIHYLAEMKKEGVFYITLVHFIERKIGTTYLSLRKSRRGLKEFGRELIREMERLKIIPDLAHASEKLMEDVLEEFKGPVIFSHTGSRSLSPIKRNIPDEVAREIFRRNGLVGIIYCTYYLKRMNLFGKTDLIADTCEHFLSLGGENSICIGSDMDGFIVTPMDLKDITQTNNLIESLKKRFGLELTEKIIFKNVLKFMEKNFEEKE